MERGVPIRAISRSIAILQCINRSGSLSLMELARAVELPYPTAFRIIQTLMHEGLVECEPQRKHYRATRMVEALSAGYRNEGRLIDAATEPMADITRRSGWPVTLSTAVGASIVLCDSTHAMSALTFNSYHRGDTFPLLECAAGHVHLAHVDAPTRESLLLGLERLGQQSVALDMFRSGKLVQRIQDDGYAVRDRTMHTKSPGKTSSIAVPVQVRGRSVAQLSLNFFVSAMTMQVAVERYVGDLRRASRIIESAISSGEQMPSALAVPPVPARKMGLPLAA